VRPQQRATGAPGRALGGDRRLPRQRRGARPILRWV